MHCKILENYYNYSEDLLISILLWIFGSNNFPVSVKSLPIS